MSNIILIKTNFKLNLGKNIDINLNLVKNILGANNMIYRYRELKEKGLDNYNISKKVENLGQYKNLTLNQQLPYITLK